MRPGGDSASRRLKFTGRKLRWVRRLPGPSSGSEARPGGEPDARPARPAHTVPVGPPRRSRPPVSSPVRPNAHRCAVKRTWRARRPCVFMGPFNQTTTAMPPSPNMREAHAPGVNFTSGRRKPPGCVPDFPGIWRSGPLARGLLKVRRFRSSRAFAAARGVVFLSGFFARRPRGVPGARQGAGGAFVRRREDVLVPSPSLCRRPAGETRSPRWAAGADRG